MTTYNLSTTSIQGCAPTVNTDTPDSLNPAADDLNTREDRLLRIGNGIRDAVVFPRLRAMGVEEVDLHRVAMRLVRQVQYGFDTDGAVAALLGVIRCYPVSHGTIAASEVV
jgi:hypothetical protein